VSGERRVGLVGIEVRDLGSGRLGRAVLLLKELDQQRDMKAAIHSLV
jgi:hypothetical protein